MENMQAPDIHLVTNDKMKKTLASFTQKIASLRTGQASAHQFEHLSVNCYGSAQPLNQVANVSIPEARQIVIKPWDASVIPAIEKAVLQSGMSLNPSNDGKVVRISIPPLTDETREHTIKQAHTLAEEAKVSIRNIRREANDKLKKLKTAGNISEDELKMHEKDTQEKTDEAIKSIQTTLEAKETEIRGV